jgi:nitrogen regulatory protein PII
MFFGIPIEPEKEIVLTLAAQEQSNAIMDNIVKELELEKPGHGICFSIPVRQSVGFSPRVSN